MSLKRVQNWDRNVRLLIFRFITVFFFVDADKAAFSTHMPELEMCLRFWASDNTPATNAGKKYHDLSPISHWDTMTEIIYARNPYPVPVLSQEGVWLQKPVLGDKVLPGDKDWGIKVKAHERLFAHHTLNSIRKDARLMRSEVPNDALDLALTTVYTHSKDTLVPKVYVTMQPETLGRKTWRVLKNVIEVKMESDSLTKAKKKKATEDPITLLMEKSECYRGPTVERRIHPSSVKLNISGPHSVQSNPGYSRKIDGTFYSI